MMSCAPRRRDSRNPRAPRRAARPRGGLARPRRTAAAETRFSFTAPVRLGPAGPAAAFSAPPAAPRRPRRPGRPRRRRAGGVFQVASPRAPRRLVEPGASCRRPRLQGGPRTIFWISTAAALALRPTAHHGLNLPNSRKPRLGPAAPHHSGGRVAVADGSRSRSRMPRRPAESCLFSSTSARTHGRVDLRERREVRRRIARRVVADQHKVG